MSILRENACFTCTWLATFALAAATGCSSGGSGDASTAGGGGNGGAASATTTTSAGQTTAGTGGSSGSATATATATVGAATTGGASSGTSASGTGGGAPNGQCPPDATFCSGFEDAGLPAGATFHPSYQAQQWADHMAIDSAVFKAGAHSLQVKPAGGGYSWNILGVPVPSGAFWVRLYVRSDVDLGQSEHNAFFQAMTSNGDENGVDNLEVAEQYCQVVLNLHDDVVVSIGGAMSCGSGGTLLAKNTWHCMEGYFDGTKGDVQVYADGAKIIDKTGWKKIDYKTLGFGFVGFHGPARTMWYDDVAVASSRIGCAP